MVELTLAAAMQLRAMLRAAGVPAAPAVRLRAAPAPGDDRVEIVLEDRSEPSDAVHESRGIRFHAAPDVASRLRGAVIDLEGTEFVARVPALRDA